jgi:hypothetical protein
VSLKERRESYDVCPTFPHIYQSHSLFCIYLSLCISCFIPSWTTFFSYNKHPHHHRLSPFCSSFLTQSCLAIQTLTLSSIPTTTNNSNHGLLTTRTPRAEFIPLQPPKHHARRPHLWRNEAIRPRPSRTQSQSRNRRLQR